MLGPQSVELFGERRRRHGLVEGVVSQGWALIFQMPLTFLVNSLSASSLPSATVPAPCLPAYCLASYHGGNELPF